ncbi:CAP domain-containing protein [Oceanobacillus bengalensis]|uniref:CAP domain-containing protein n=1 Tax=Oceanobacillus bengalensis TaxID=1435466 RepID=A0A494Z1Z8_9BACI|nr:CAP domain-containing protein [Oceanobacillus bengalensis]RKQ16330.1 hypothetical protein D8M05_07570 [Oceanobacillus bengalensis]
MRFIQSSLVLLSIIVLVVFYFIQENDMTKEGTIGNIDNIVEKRSQLELKEVPEVPSLVNGEVFQWIGKSQEELVKALGEPVRKDQSAYEYEWWIYTDERTEYIQFGILNNEIITIYGTGDNLDSNPIQIGQAYGDVNDIFDFSNEVTYKEGIASYTFHLSEEDMIMRPLIKLKENMFLQVYFDTVTNKVSSIRVLTGDVLLRHRIYEIVYRGDLPAEPKLTDEEWEEVGLGMEKQVFTITNIIRNRYEKAALQWDNSVGEVAFLHSRDMAENDYFSHFGLNGDGLKERLAAREVYYVAAGENIAAQYTDAPAAIEGWLNSEGHREALLSDTYSHIGVGVYRLYYTQNFLAKTNE